MDWTLVFTDDGGEAIEVAIPPAVSCPPRMSRFVSKTYEHHAEKGFASNCNARGWFHLLRFGGICNRSGEVNNAIATELEDSSHLPPGRTRQEYMTVPRDSFESERDDSDQNGYNLSALYFLSINYILGVGCLGVPYAFAKAGWVLASFLVVFVSILSYMTVMWVAETCIRADVLQQYRIQTQTEQQQKNGLTKGSHDNLTNNNANQLSSQQQPPHQDETTSLVFPPLTSPYRGHRSSIESAADNHTTSSSLAGHDLHANERYMHEVTDLIDLFLGPVHHRLYQMSLLALMYIGLLAYTQVFVNSVVAIFGTSTDHDDESFVDDDAATIPSSSSFASRWKQDVVPLMCFSILVIPLACSELEEQLSLQALLSAFRFAAILVMVVGSVVAILISSEDDDDSASAVDHPSDVSSSFIVSSRVANFSGFGVAFSTALFSQLFQHSIPGLIRPLSEHSRAERQKIPYVLAGCLATTCFLYLILGSSASSYFQQQTNSSVNLNFVHFYYGMTPSTLSAPIRYMIDGINYIVVLFPALDTISVFPLVTITLGKNIYSSVYSTVVPFIEKCLPEGCGQSTTITKTGTENTTSRTYISRKQRKLLRMKQASKICTLLCRLVAAIPPLVASLFASDLSFSLQLAGAAGVYVAFVAPSLLQWSSVRTLKEEMDLTEGSKDEQTAIRFTSSTITFDFRRTIYSGWYSNTAFATPVLLFAAFSFTVVLIHIRDAWMEMTTQK